MARHNDIGKQGEDLACDFLEAKEFLIFDRNYNYGKEEIDIVAFRDNLLHFVEVKTRSNDGIASPELSVTHAKQKRLAKVAGFYLWERQLMTVPAVFDVIAIGLDDPENPVFRHHEDVFRPEISI